MKTTTLAALLALATTAGSALAAPAAKIADLAWMTGTWQAPFGNNVLEENWISAGENSIGALVRMTSPAGIGMWEVITIEEKDGSLAMSVQQWGKGFEPRATSTTAQKLVLDEIDKQRVKFKAVTEGSMTTLQYSRSADGVFSIEMGVPKGNPMKMDLKAKK